MPTAALLLFAMLAAPPPDAAFESIVSGLAGRSHEDSCMQMASWLSANPNSPEVPRGLLWVARIRLLEGRSDLARPLMERARHEGAGTRWENAALKELADLDAAEHRFSEAIAGYDRLASSPERYWSTLGQLAAKSARAERVRWYSGWGVGLALFTLVAFRLSLALRSGTRLLPVPLEAWIALPVAAALLFLAFKKPPAQLQAVTTIAVGGLALLWANTVVLRGRVLSGRRRAGEVLLAAGQALALSYCAFVGSGLWAKLLATLRLGAD
ncbi:MAG: hypothetical protein QM765_49070 [Myxococcales bacterium]